MLSPPVPVCTCVTIASQTAEEVSAILCLTILHLQRFLSRERAIFAEEKNDELALAIAP